MHNIQYKCDYISNNYNLDIVGGLHVSDLLGLSVGLLRSIYIIFIVAYLYCHLHVDDWSEQIPIYRR